MLRILNQRENRGAGHSIPAGIAVMERASSDMPRFYGLSLTLMSFTAVSALKD